MALDKSKPYGEAYGSFGRPQSSWRYTQDGKLFNESGVEIDEDGNVLGQKMVRDEHGQADNVKLEDLSWRAVKKLVRKNGGEWTSKADGIKFLGGLDSPDFSA
ncbi:MAG: hypothetical protein QF577_08155 [Phycisphaerae bacterium]|jgi:hypothetical protein|nr:hypothetical protein [Phycisphaerae bacterium]|tara:strand:+ start:1979 stop:2287 length:309 start_codon:yes stop_codon:yes gene_type:complete